MAEEWLNGWHRNGTSVLVGTGVHCAGCGKFHGITCVAFSADWEPPEKLPDWPFNKDTCPVCELEKKTPPFTEGPEDKLTARLLALRNKPK